MGLSRDIVVDFDLDSEEAHSHVLPKRFSIDATIGGALVGATNLDEGIRRLLHATVDALDWDIGIFWAMDYTAGRLHLLHGSTSRRSETDPFVEGSRRHDFAPGEGIPGRVFRTGRAFWLVDVSADTRYHRSQLALEHGVKSMATFPVTHENHCFGVLEFCAKRTLPPNDDLLRLMGGIAAQTGQFLQRNRATERLREDVMVQALMQVERNSLRSLFTQAPTAIAVFRGPDFRYELSNPSHRKLMGGRDLTGQTLREAFPSPGAFDIQFLVERAYQGGEPVAFEELQVMLPRPADGVACKAFMSGVLQPLRNVNGIVDGVVLFAHDVTELVSARARIERAEERLRLALDASSVGSWEFFPDTGAILCDAKFKTFFGLPSSAVPTTTEITQAIHPEDREWVVLTTRRTLDRSSGGEYAIEYRTLGAMDRPERWISARGRTFFDERGRARRFLGTASDVTRERRALDRTTLLAQAGTVLASSLDYRATLAEVVRLAIPRVADWCAIELVNERGEVESTEVSHVDPTRLEAARAIRGAAAQQARTGLLSGVIRCGEPAFAATATDEFLLGVALDEHQVGALRELGTESAIFMPLRGRGRTLGALALSYAESGRRYSEDDLVFAEELARRAAIAIENAVLYRAAEMAVRQRDDFLSVASHELKTPVSTLLFQIEGFLGDLRHGALGQDEIRSRLDKSLSQVHRLSNLLDDLLDVSRMATGHLRILRTTMDLGELALEVTSRLRDAARRAGCRMDMKIAGRLVGQWDRDRLDQVLTNLLSNAFKFAPGKPVELRVDNRGDRIAVVVRDHGKGIFVEDRERVFNRFERTSAADGVGGLGLGLWIAKEIVRAHGGDIRVEEEPGPGAAFSMELPIAPR